MTDRAVADDGSIADIPWATVFDPDHNVRAFNAIQERGFRAASSVVERLIGMANGNGATHSASETPASETEPPATDSAPPLDVQRAVTAWQSILGQIVGSAGGGTAPTPAGSLVVDLNQNDARDVMYLEAPAGASAAAELWLHNGSPTDVEPVALRCSDLLAHDGGLIKSSGVQIDPDYAPMPGRCSRGVTVRVDVPFDAQPGRYRGTLLANGHPDLWLPIVLTVLPEPV